MGVALDDELRTHLDAAAEKAGRSVAEEIRQRLQATIKDDQRVPELRDLLGDIELLVNLVGDDTGFKWSGHPFAFAVLKAGIIALLDQRKPEDYGWLKTLNRDYLSVSRLSDSDDPDIHRPRARPSSAPREDLPRMGASTATEEGGGSS
jgi:hypothetical protein